MIIVIALLTILEYRKQVSLGKNHLYFERLMDIYGDNGDSSNILIPIIDGDSNQMKELAIIANPEDASRIALKHVKKCLILNQ